MWAVQDYATYSPGLEWLETFVDVVKAERLGRDAGTLIDVGCGDGRAGMALAAKGFDVTLCDLTRTASETGLPFVQGSIWALPETTQYDYAYCCDVFEHLPTEFTMLSIDRLLRVARRAFLTVCTQPDSFGVRIGEPLHLTVQPFTWWRDRIGEVATILDARDCQQTAVFYVERPAL